MQLNPMILLDAIYINNSGGKILLDYLITELENSDLAILYFLDHRIKGNHPAIKTSNTVIYTVASLAKRHILYKKYQTVIEKVLCFGNLPPTIKLNVPVYTYFHQKLFLEIPQETPWKQKLTLSLKAIIFKILRSNTQFWLVQTVAVKREFLDKFPDLNADNVLLMPFYPSTSSTYVSAARENDSFVFVSNASPYKNHVRLLEGFSTYYKKHQVGKLYVTVGDEFPALISLITAYQLAGIPILNVGFLQRKDLEQLYQKCAFLIFPSLTESFGLGILEAMESGCKIIGADLPYTYAVCKPSLVFNPFDVDSIANAFKEAITKNVKPTEQLVFNDIDKLINLLRDNENTK